ncbi:2-hydroxymuconic semialdehyde dehydrogenase [Parapedomonas caeni]
MSASTPPRAIQHFIDGRYVPSANGATFEKFSPVDGTLMAHVSEAGEADVDAAVSAARAALRGPWGRMGVDERLALINRIADEIERRFDDFLDAECADTGKPKSLARRLDIPRGSANFRAFTEIVKTHHGQVYFKNTPSYGVLNYTLSKPRGVIAIIAPWNLPLLLTTWKLAPALATGNAVVVKPSEETPSTTALLGEVMNAVDVPAGVFNVVHGLGPNSAGEFLTRHPGVNGITFTGETGTGEAIMRQAATGTRPVSFEMGGKNPALVFADANLDKAIPELLRSCFLNSGQVCLGTERAYVHRTIFDEVVERLSAGAAKMKIAPPSDPDAALGPLISQGHRDKVLGYYRQAKAAGATVVLGGGVPAMEGALANGSWVEPTIWTGLPEDASVIREEVFGPCVHLRPFDDEDEAIQLGNDTPYGLTASIWTQDVSRAHRVAGAMDVGLCWINSWFLRDLRTPFGGAKRSGIGREGGNYSLEFYTEMKNVCIDI